MSGIEDDQSYEVLPQRQPRERKRQRKDEELKQLKADESTPDAGLAPASETEVEPATSEESCPPETDTTKGDAPGQTENQEDEDQDLQKYRSGKVEGYNFEYLDHTADIQLHAWGDTLQEAFENVGLAMFNYMTPLEGIDPESKLSKTFEAEGHDMQSLMYHYLDELLFGFATEFFVPRTLKITTFDRENWRIVAEGVGETFDRQRHACGTEIKAITYSAMQINENANDSDVFVIVDI